MPVPRGTIGERPELALAGLLRGDVDAIKRALLQPQTLAPTQIQTLAERWGVADGIFGAALRTVTDPIFMVGLLLSMRFPIPLARNMFKYGKKLGSYESKASIMSFFRSPLDTYAGTASKDALLGIGSSRKEFAERHLPGLAEALTNLETKLGRNLTKADDVLAHALGDVLPIKAPIRLKRGMFTGEAPDWAVNGKAWLKVPTNRPELDEYVEGLRKFTDGILDDVSVVTAQDLRTRRVTQVRWKGLPDAKPVEIPERYYPHAVASRYSDVNEQVARHLEETIKQLDLEKGRQFIPDSVRQNIKNAVSAKPSPHTLIRQKRMIPDPQELKLIREHLVDPDMPEILEAFLQTEPGQKFRTYSLQGTRVLQDYANQMSKTYGWHAKGHGKNLMSDLAIFKGKGPRSDPLKGHLLENHFIPAILEQHSDRMIAIEGWWAGKLARGYTFMQNPAARKAVGEKWANQIQGWLLAERGPLQLGNLGYAAQAYLYGSTISGNVAMATLNLGQTFLTLGTFINPKYLAAGFSKTMKGMSGYFKHRKAGLIHERALQQAWPEFGKAGLSYSPITEEAIGGALRRAWTLSGTPEAITTFGRGLDRVRRASMSLFTGSETFNRVWGFESAFIKYTAEARAAGFKGAAVATEARKFAVETVQQAHFLAGAELSPAFMARWPGVLKQFGQFPWRSLEFLTGASTKFGSAADAGLAGRNWGTLGRMGMMYSAARHVGDATGVDLERGIGFESMFPIAPDFSPAGPIPVPPIISLALAGVRDLTAGEFKFLPYSAPLLLPGGIAAMRAGSVLAPLVAPDAGPEIMQNLGRKYVDYRNPGPDGKYPMFTRNGQLMGYFGPWDLFQMGTGVGRGGQGARTERDLMGYLVTQRERIRDHRRQWLQRLGANDQAGADRIKADFDNLYPGVGLAIKPSDIQAVQMRREIPRLERILDTLPPDIRPIFAEIIQDALLAGGQDLLGIDPRMLGTGTARTRGAGIRPPQPQYQQNMGPLRSEPGQIQPRQQALPDALQGFQSFASF